MPPYSGSSWGWWGIAALVGVGVLGLAIALVARIIARRGGSRGDGIVTQFSPPSRLLPITAADFLGVSERGAAAHLVWLIEQGHAELRSQQAAVEPASPSARRTRTHQMIMRWSADGLESRAAKLTEALFGAPDVEHTITPHSLRGWRSSDRLRDTMLRNAGLRTSSTNSWMSAVFFIGFCAIVGLGIVQAWMGLDGLGWFWLAGGLVGTMLLITALHIAPSGLGLTEDGQRVRRELAGLERFVTMADADRIAWMQGVDTAPRDDEGRVRLYEQLLPWAVVFGEEATWTSLVGDMIDRFPDVEAPTTFALRDLVSGRFVIPDDAAERARWRKERAMSGWSSRADFGEGSLSSGWREFTGSVGNAFSGRGSSSSSTRSSGRGWSGGKSGGSGSSGSGHSGGGVGGGGGSRW